MNELARTNYTNILDIVSNSIYTDAFLQQTNTLWMSTPFKNEASELCWMRAQTAFMRNNQFGEEDRRNLLYWYMAPMFDVLQADSTLNKMRKILPTDNNYIMRILRNLCVLYNVSPVRQFDDNDIATKAYKDALDNMNFDMTMQKVYRIAKLCGTAALRIRKILDEPYLQILTPDVYRIKYNLLNVPIEMWIAFTENKNGVDYSRFEIWDSENYRVVDANCKPLVFEYEGAAYQGVMPNPYKRIPYVFLNMDADSNIFGGGLWELCKKQLHANYLEHLERESLTYCGFTFYMATNCGLTENKNLTLSPGKVFAMDNIKQQEGQFLPPTIETVNGSSYFSDINEYRKQYMQTAARDMGLPSSLIESNAGLRPSGVAMEADMSELGEIRNEDINTLINFEYGFMELLQVVYKTSFKITLPNFKNIAIKFADMKVYTEPKDELANIVEMKNNNLISPLDFYKKFSSSDYIKTDDDAIKEMKKNADYFKQLTEVDDVNNTRDNGVGAQSTKQNGGIPDQVVESSANFDSAVGTTDSGIGKQDQQTN